MNVEIGAEAALFPEKEYTSGIFVAVLIPVPSSKLLFSALSAFVCSILTVYKIISLVKQGLHSSYSIPHLK
jgi:hypothetical protein